MEPKQIKTRPAEQDTADKAWVPSACTLPTAEQPLRVAEFDALFAGAVQGVTRPDRTRLRWDLECDPETAAQAAGLAARENGCCSFFTFVLTIADGVMSLEVQVPDGQVEVLDALHRRTETAAAPAGGRMTRDRLPGGDVMDRISREDLLAMFRTGTVQLIEALPAEAYHAEHLPGAGNLPDRVTAEDAATVAPDRDAPVVVYCSGPYCNRSRIAAAALVHLGYRDVRVYTGGKQDWAEAGLPFEGTRAGAHT